MENIALLFIYNIHHIYLRYTFWFDYVYVGWRKCVWTNIFCVFWMFVYAYIHCQWMYLQTALAQIRKVTNSWNDLCKKKVGFPRQCGLCGPWCPERAIKFNHSPTLSTGMCGLILCHWDGSFKTKTFYVHKLWKKSVLGKIKIKYKSYIWKNILSMPQMLFLHFLFTNACWYDIIMHELVYNIHV